MAKTIDFSELKKSFDLIDAEDSEKKWNLFCSIMTNSTEKLGREITYDDLIDVMDILPEMVEKLDTTNITNFLKKCITVKSVNPRRKILL